MPDILRRRVSTAVDRDAELAVSNLSVVEQVDVEGPSWAAIRLVVEPLVVVRVVDGRAPRETDSDNGPPPIRTLDQEVGVRILAQASRDGWSQWRGAMRTLPDRPPLAANATASLISLTS